MLSNSTINASNKNNELSPANAGGAPYLALASFTQFARKSAGHLYVKIVWDRESDALYLIDGNLYSFHVDFIAEKILQQPRQELRDKIDDFNAINYFKQDRRFMLGVISLHTSSNGPFFAVETSEVDTMTGPMLNDFWKKLVAHCDPALPIFVKPANHGQEEAVKNICSKELPRLLHHEIFATEPFVPLNAGEAKGRLRVFSSNEEYNKKRPTIKWYDIIVMDRVPDDVPRIAGMLMNQHTTPLSHTNVLAGSWQIPNAVQIGIIEKIQEDRLDGAWVEYSVDSEADEVLLKPLEGSIEAVTEDKPLWMNARIRLESPDIGLKNISSLSKLRSSDHRRYGTKAANLGELFHTIEAGSKRLTGFYRVPRPPRKNLISYLEDYLKKELLPQYHGLSIEDQAQRFLRQSAKVPRGIAIPFSIQQCFLETSPKIQQCIGKLKMALELNAIEADSLAVQLQNHIRQTRMNDELRDAIDAQITTELAGVTSFIVRSSSNAEDLKGFPAAGMYESINHLTTSDKIFESIKEVWASLVSPRSVRLRHEVGISLDDCYMGVIIQEELSSDIGGVMVTANPTKGKTDFRNVYINASNSAENVVSGGSLPDQYLFNTVEGGGRTISKGNQGKETDEHDSHNLQKLSFVGRLLASHFSTDYTFSDVVDIEWMLDGDTIYLLQLRPYGL